MCNQKLYDVETAEGTRKNRIEGCEAVLMRIPGISDGEGEVKIQINSRVV